MTNDPRNDAKRRAAERACELVEPGMLVGLGSGSTAEHAVRRLGERVRAGLTIIGVPTSERTRQVAEELGIRLTTLADHPRLDLTIDGADEVDPRLNLVKGRGGALVREKIVASASERLVIVIDDTKCSERLGRSPVPVEVVPFGWKPAYLRLQQFSTGATLRLEGEAPYTTDNGNYLIDCQFDSIDDPGGLERRLRAITGVVDCGLFVGMTDVVVVATDSRVEVRNRYGTVEGKPTRER